MSLKLGEMIIDRSRKLGISQKELANLVGVTDTTMSRYINGTREPKIEILSNISSVLQISIDELVGQQRSESSEDEFPKIKRLIARNSKHLTMDKKRELINVLLSE